MKMADFTSPFLRVIEDWRTRRPKQARNSLPPSYTSSTLQYIRVNACMHKARETIECSKWSQTDPWPVDPAVSSAPFSSPEKKGPFMLTHDYRCAQCRHPIVSIDLLIRTIGVGERKVGFSDRTWRRYVNAKDPMPVDQFRQAVRNGFLQGWLGLWQFLSIMLQIDQLNTSRKTFLAVFRRASERKAFRERKVVDISEDEVNRELKKQLRLLDREATRVIDQHLRAENLPLDVIKFMEETRFPDSGVR